MLAKYSHLIAIVFKQFQDFDFLGFKWKTWNFLRSKSQGGNFSLLAKDNNLNFFFPKGTSRYPTTSQWEKSAKKNIL